jgi:SAM-dependent methyltransferase
MPQTPKAEFDAFAGHYNRALRECLRASGETPDYFADYKAQYLVRRGSVGPDSRILDFGCGVGNLIGALRRRVPGVLVDGYDPSPASLEHVYADVKGLGRFSSDLADLPGAYDTVVLAGVLHHVQPEKRAGAVAEAVSQLRPGGSLVIFEHNPLNPLTRRVVDVCPFDKDAILLPARETVNLMIGTALISVQRDYIVFFPRAFRALRPLEPALGWCPLGAQYAITGTHGEESKASR